MESKRTNKAIKHEGINKTSRTRLFSRLAVFINNLLLFIRQLSSTNTYRCLPSHQPIKQSSQKASLNLQHVCCVHSLGAFWLSFFLGAEMLKQFVLCRYTYYLTMRCKEDLVTYGRYINPLCSGVLDFLNDITWF